VYYVFRDIHASQCYCAVGKRSVMQADCDAVRWEEASENSFDRAETMVASRTLAAHPGGRASVSLARGRSVTRDARLLRQLHAPMGNNNGKFHSRVRRAGYRCPTALYYNRVRSVVITPDRTCYGVHACYMCLPTFDIVVRSCVSCRPNY